MSIVMKIFLSMSCSGGLLILILLLGKRVLGDRISRQWQYYIWLVVVLRLLIPFEPQISLLGKAYQAADQAIARAGQLPQASGSLPTPSAMQPSGSLAQQPSTLTPPGTDSDTSGGVPAPAAGLAQERGNADSREDDLEAIHPLQDIGKLLADHIWLVWLAGALGLLIRRITIYQSFVRYINAGSAPVSDMEMLDRLSVTARQAGIKKPIELCVNPLISSPLLMGFFRPCILLPSADISEKDFQYIILHELTHCRRGDMFYKWLVQMTVCLHWFNPLVHLMSREISRACEFSCDEAVLAKMGRDSARDYGKTLLDAMAAVGRYRENPGAVTLSENKQLLRERLEALMKFREQSKTVKVLTAALTFCVVLGAAFTGIYTVGTAAGHVQAAPLFGMQEEWLLLEDEKWNFQSTLFHVLGRDDEFDELEEKQEKEWEEAQTAEYGAADIAMAGSASQEAAQGRVWHPQVIPVDLETMAEGEIVWLGEYTLSHGDRIWYAVTAETGKGLQVGFARPGDESLDEVYYSVHSLRHGDEELECIASAKFGDPVKPGTYLLFLRAADGALENVKGSVSIGFKAEAEAY